jgi:DNA-binding transcriptional ArsR family regulator
MEQPVKVLIIKNMRPLFHPSVEDITIEGILHALSDPLRVAIYAKIASSGCPQTCSHFLDIGERSVPKSTLSQHFKALREAGLIRSERQGNEMHNTSRCADIEQRFPGLLRAILNAYSAQTKERQRASSASKRKPASRGA